MFFLLFNYVQVMVTGCPLGFTPTFDTGVGFENAQGCQTANDCPIGSDCMFSPVSPVNLCCKQNASAIQNTTVADFPTTLIYGRDVQMKANDSQQPLIIEINTPEVTTEKPTTVPTEIDMTLNDNGLSTNILIPLPGVWSRLPDVRPIVVGRLQSLSNRPNVLQRYSSVTLIRDAGYNILVDTASGPRQNDIRAGLAALGISPAQIHMVILTHGHPDHFGNAQIFPSAQFLYGRYLYKGEEFLSYGLKQGQAVKLTENVDIWSTPGHTPDSVSVIVKNVPYGGVVAITGDLFTSEMDLEDVDLWMNISGDPSIQQKSRNYMICRVNWIVPGHDKMFKVSNSSRIASGCTATTPELQIPFPQLPQHSSYEEQNAIRYAYFAYNVRDMPISIQSAANPGSPAVVMNDQQSIPNPATYQQPYGSAAGFMPNQQYHSQEIPLKQPQLSMLQQSAVPMAPVPASPPGCCVLVENEAKKFLQGPAAWQQPYQLTYAAPESGASQYRNGKN